MQKNARGPLIQPRKHLLQTLQFFLFAVHVTSEMSCHRDYLILDFKQKSEALGCAREHTVLILKLTGGMKHQSLLSTEAEGLLTTPALAGGCWVFYRGPVPAPSHPITHCWGAWCPAGHRGRGHLGFPREHWCITLTRG